jgi:hypothetical protein
MEYSNLTKIVVNSSGERHVSCAYENTDKCLKCKGKTCSECNIFEGILIQLNCFENILNEVDLVDNNHP